jgi:hypothetical protein
MGLAITVHGQDGLGWAGPCRKRYSQIFNRRSFTNRPAPPPTPPLSLRRRRVRRRNAARRRSLNWQTSWPEARILRWRLTTRRRHPLLWLSPLGLQTLTFSSPLPDACLSIGCGGSRLESTAQTRIATAGIISH